MADNEVEGTAESVAEDAARARRDSSERSTARRAYSDVRVDEDVEADDIAKEKAPSTVDQVRRSARSGARGVDVSMDDFVDDEERRDEEASRVEVAESVAESQDDDVDITDDTGAVERPEQADQPDVSAEVASFGREDGVEMSSAEVRVAAERAFRANMSKANPFTGDNATKSARSSVNMGNAIHQMYARELVRACVRDLDNDVSMKSITSALTTAAVLWALSPAFRDITSDFGDRARARVVDHIDETRDKIRSSKIGQAFFGSQHKYEKAVSEADRDDANFAKFRQACMSATDTVPMDVHSASMTYLSLQENAYEAVRTGTNPALVDSKLSEMLKEYGAQWSAAGVEMSAVIDHSRTLMAQRGAQDPSYFAMFDNYGWAETSPASVADGKSAWNGHWVRANGQIIGAKELPEITYRRPASASDQAQHMGTSVAASLLGVYERKGAEAFQDALVGVNLGFDPQTCVYFDAQSQPGDPSGVGAVMRRRGQTMTAALIDDGFSSEEIMAFKSTMMEGVMDALYNVSPEIKALCANPQFTTTTVERIAEVKNSYVERAQQGTWGSNMIPTRTHVQIREGIGRSQAAAEQGVALITEGGTAVGFDGQVDGDHDDQVGATEVSDRDGGPQKQMEQSNDAPDPERRRGKPDWQKDMGDMTAVPDNASSYNDFMLNKAQKHQELARRSDYGYKGQRSVKSLTDNQETSFVDESAEGHSSRSRNTVRRQRIVTTNQKMNNEDDMIKAAKQEADKQAEIEMDM